jgi:hypothetical protein
MARGGWNKGFKVPGSGRKPGTKNKATIAKEQMIKGMLAKMAVDAQDPLTFFASILKNPDAPFEERKYAASELLPFMHPKLSSIEARTGGRTHEDRLAEMQQLLSEDEQPRQLTSDEGGEG